ncbi:hypothetical protein WDW86_08285 [Bdellovibrionota bacterium FG-2]
MRVVDFLSFILRSHGQILLELAAFLQEDVLFEVLEQAGELDRPPTAAEVSQYLSLQSLHHEVSPSYESPFVLLEQTVRELHLSPVLEFHLWAYPHYRAFVESSVDLGTHLIADAKNPALVTTLVHETLEHAQEWVKTLPLPPESGRLAEAISRKIWLRFRTEVLKKVGLRPIAATP